MTAARSGYRPSASATYVFAVLAALFSTLRFALAVYLGRGGASYGDYAATLPGGYAEHLNPTLWNSPDLRGSWAFHQHTYFHGPTQFLTLYPVVFLDSYAQISRVLLVAYAAVVLGVVYVVWRMLCDAEGGRVSLVAVYAVTLSFFPLLQAYSQREFEIVIVLAVAAMYRAAVQNRQGWVGAAVAFVTWFKYLPIVLVAYLGFRRWWRAVGSFVVCSAAILIAAHLLFDLRHFVDNQVPSVAGGHLAAFTGAVDFCRGFLPKYYSANRTFVSVRWALCTLDDENVAVRPLLAYLMLAGATASLAVFGFLRLDRVRADLSAREERWSRVLELSVVVTVYTTFFFAHYYYLSVLVVPLAALLIRFLRDGRWLSVALWFAVYALLSPFTLPGTVFDRLFHLHPTFNAWDTYMRGVAYLPGELGLLALLFREYLAL